MKYIIYYIVLVLLLNGCNLLEVRVDVAQRAIIDKGDNTKDDYNKLGDSKSTSDLDKTTTVLKTIP